MRCNTTQKMALEQAFRYYERPLGGNEVLTYGRKSVGCLIANMDKKPWQTVPKQPQQYFKIVFSIIDLIISIIKSKHVKMEPERKVTYEYIKDNY